MAVDVSPTAFERHLRTVKAIATAAKYADAAKTFLMFCEAAQVRLATAPMGLFGAFISWMATHRKLSPSSIHVMYAGANRYVEWRRNQGETIPHLSRPDLPQVETREPEILDHAELTAFLASATEIVPEPCQMALVLLPYCGLRSSEHVALQLADVRIDQVDGRRVVTLKVVGKGKKHRYVPVLEAVYPRLQAYLSGWRRQRQSAWLFPSTRKGAGVQRGPGHMLAKTMREWMVDVRRHAGLAANVTPHTMRRTYASTLRAMGYDEATIADILGHESVDTTRKHYFAISSPQELWQRLRAKQHHQHQ